jgi:hypothetical protein
VLQAQRKQRAARIGPTVWLLLGPMPILNRSKTETAMVQGCSGLCRLWSAA